MKFDIVTIFPNFFNNFLTTSIIKRACLKKQITVIIHDLRFYSKNKNHRVDDTPYGGGVGMVLTLPPFYECLQSIPRNNKSRIVLLSPQGKVLNQNKVIQYSQKFSHLIILCGNYEGIDARILKYIDEELSIGDYVLTGGEIAATVLIDAITRLLPGVIKKDSYLKDSHQNGLLKQPQYTRPQIYKEQKVPEVILSGNHDLIEKWNQKESLRNTFLKRPELLNNIILDEKKKKLLEEIKLELKNQK